MGPEILPQAIGGDNRIFSKLLGLTKFMRIQNPAENRSADREAVPYTFSEGLQRGWGGGVRGRGERNGFRCRMGGVAWNSD